MITLAQQLSLVHGPYAFVYYSRDLGCVIFGRDPFGRRSLLSVRINGALLALVSVV
jgi:asparagine synthetase B (glutamine-hydrolysing)